MKKSLKSLPAGLFAVLVAQNAWAQDPVFSFLTKMALFLQKIAAPAGIVAIIFGVFSVWLAIEQSSYTIAFKICVGIAIIASAPALTRFFLQMGFGF